MADDQSRPKRNAGFIAVARAWCIARAASLSGAFLALRIKVFVTLTAAGVGLVVLSGVFVLHLYTSQVETLIKARATSLGEVLGNSIRHARAPSDLQFIVDAVSGSSRVDLVAILDSGNNILAVSRPEWRGLSAIDLPDPAVRREFAVSVKQLERLPSADAKFADFMMPVTSPSAGEARKLFFRVNVDATLTGLQQTAWSIVVWLAAAAIVSVVTIFLMMQRLVIAPIEILRDYAERRGATKFTTPKGPRDEIAIVAAALGEAFQMTNENESRIALLARTDSLTGLGNRAHFKMRLAQELAADHGAVAVMILNLDKFKDINDTLGHDSGDVILQRTAEILKNCHRGGDAMARLGADEFGVILTGISGPEEAVEYATRFIRAVGAPFRIGAHEIHQTACVGLTIYPQDGRDPDVLMKNADLALSRAKLEGASACILYRHELHLRAMERNSIERDLRVALSQKQFVLFYQPKVDIRTGRISGAEALIRWQHPERGLVAPDLFIPVAERCGFIAEVTKWVLEEACRQNRTWQDAGLPKIGIAVNVSAVDLRRPDLTDIVANTLVRHQISPQYLELEVTESMVMRDVDVVIGTLRRLRSLGVGIGIDDFGTGYSSLAYLKRFPVKRLKIDRSFVRDIADLRDGKVIPKVIIDLAHSLSVNVLAEGVEDAEQLEILRNLGCDEAQGYFLGRPMPAAEFELFLRHAPNGLHPDAAIRNATAVVPSVPLPLRGGSAA
ncbi:putative bifunctional diguanylate cyclase/phosphodiesterase [Parvibaculum sp.]|uniref:putative bifunctional diguanylate cyclase/phosphodiesterase n=1 Tax=Parvibaculum sp. TaxID=2024848 RepID=UPI002C077596|nr:EAL domain-containing protein [Parvibaculum sp.]HUD51701.1 EAL domain-containing protein [Parvibaculum sp.]